MSFASDVWDRGGSDTMPRGIFYLVLGGVLTWGFFFTMIVAKATAGWQPGVLMFLLVGLGIPIVGILLSSSGSPILSFIGFNLVVGGLSAILGPALAQVATVQPGLIERTALFTGIGTGGMAISGVMFPRFYKGIGGILFGALVALVVVSIARLFIPAIQGVGIIDYAAVVIFSLYIGFDMWRASEIPATLDNAVDVAVALYLDIINLFLTLLRILKD